MMIPICLQRLVEHEPQDGLRLLYLAKGRAACLAQCFQAVLQCREQVLPWPHTTLRNQQGVGVAYVLLKARIGLAGGKS